MVRRLGSENLAHEGEHAQATATPAIVSTGNAQKELVESMILRDTLCCVCAPDRRETLSGAG